VICAGLGAASATAVVGMRKACAVALTVGNHWRSNRRRPRSQDVGAGGGSLTAP
jgi:L-aminopeptidase/D-esterase-like protein